MKFGAESSYLHTERGRENVCVCMEKKRKRINGKSQEFDEGKAHLSEKEITKQLTKSFSNYIKM